jgi:hypothetical protein
MTFTHYFYIFNALGTHDCYKTISSSLIKQLLHEIVAWTYVIYIFEGFITFRTYTQSLIMTFIHYSYIYNALGILGLFNTVTSS